MFVIVKIFDYNKTSRSYPRMTTVPVKKKKIIRCDKSPNNKTIKLN